MRTYLCDDGNAELEIEADSAQEAAQEYVDGGSWGEIESTTWVTVYVWQHIQCADCAGSGSRSPECARCTRTAVGYDSDGDPICGGPHKESPHGDAPPEGPCSTCRGTGEVDGDRDSITIALEPEEPACADGEEHDWKSPYSVLGGLKENPGVWGNGGGVIIKRVCAHCGVYRIVDTWAQNPETGEQGLDSTEYEDADEASMAWVERRRANA